MQLIFEKLDELKAKIDSADNVIDSYRIFHGRGKTFPELDFVTLDWFHPVILVILFREPPDNWIIKFIDRIPSHLSTKVACVVVQHRYVQGDPSDIVYGQLPEKTYAIRGPLRFHLHLAQQQNTGFFLDIEPARQWLELQAKEKRILNLFSYTCSFSVVALASGAEKVVNVDMSGAALNLGRSNHQLNNLDKRRSQYLAENILKSWGRIKRAGPYDLVILDPPSFQKGSFDAGKDYAKLIRRLPELMPVGGLILSCLNNPDLNAQFLIDLFVEHCPMAQLKTRLPSHPDFPDAEPDRQLKMLVFSLIVEL